MLFRSARLYRLPDGFEHKHDADALAVAISPQAFRPCPPMTEEVRGWVSPYGPDRTQLVATAAMGAGLLRMRHQFRVLPSAAVDEVLAERVVEFQERMGRTPRRRELRDLREQVHASLLPKALLRSRYSWCLIDAEEGWIAVGETSDAKADAVLDLLREGVGSLPLIPLQFEHGVSGLLSRIVTGDAPSAFQAGDRCQLRDPAAGATEVRYRNANLGDPAVQKYVEDGMRVGALEIVRNGEFSFVLSEHCALSSMRLLDTSGGEECDDADLRLEADLALTASTLRRLIVDLAVECGGIAA